MHHGVFIFPTDYSIRIDELARAAEDRGFESLFVTEHTHIPTSRRSPFGGGGPLPKEYSHTLDPFIGLMAAAAATKNLKIGTGICLVIEHDPITLAKTIASLDLLSNGRFLFGIGAGWNAEEMENHGTEFKTRFRLLRERILAMKEISSTSIRSGRTRSRRRSRTRRSCWAARADTRCSESWISATDGSHADVMPTRSCPASPI
jgi:alkanesulfonate monooxygenase SsuD/methylene tetrahydromethanopterin reductase-like flavin-dependent oxidoreductase (luciferase family)